MKRTRGRASVGLAQPQASVFPGRPWWHHCHQPRQSEVFGRRCIQYFSERMESLLIDHEECLVEQYFLGPRARGLQHEIGTVFALRNRRQSRGPSEETLRFQARRSITAHRFNLPDTTSGTSVRPHRWETQDAMALYANAKPAGVCRPTRPPRVAPCARSHR